MISQNLFTYLKEQSVHFATKRVPLIQEIADKAPYIPYERSESLKYFERRVDNEFRWSRIQPYIDNQTTFLDIGCAQGYFVKKAAQEGALSWGIDKRQSVVLDATRNKASIKNTGFANWELKPENVDILPNFDIISLQTVVHWLYKDHGYDSTKYILQQLASKCDQFVYEPPGTSYIGTKDLIAKLDDVESNKTHQVLISSDEKGLFARPRFGDKLPPRKI